MRNFKLVLFSEKEKQDLVKGCLYIDYEPGCVIDVCTTADNGGCSGTDICGADNSNCSFEDICATDNSVGGCFIDQCSVDNTDGECNVSDRCYNDNTDGNCNYDQCIND